MRVKKPDPRQLAAAYEKACEEELQAFKPGNVSVFSDGHDMTVEDFRRSAIVSAPWMVNFELALGEKMFYSVHATREAVGCNTNLGIVLLCAPLLQAAWQRAEGQSLRDSLSRVLNTTTIKDAGWVYRAIRVASPGGLGQSEKEDVHDAPTVTLTEAMALASGRDRIAYQYISDYRDVFEIAVIRYNAALKRWGDAGWAAAAVFLALLRRFPDSHIERKFGDRFTGMVAGKIALLDEELFNMERPEQSIHRFRETDDAFKSAGINPGTTADLTVATSLVFHLEKLIDGD